MKGSSRGGLLVLVAVIALFLLSILPLVGNIHDIHFLGGRGIEFSGMPTAGGPPPESPGWQVIAVLVRIFAAAAVLAFLFELLFNRSFRRFFLFIALLVGTAVLASELLGLDQMPPNGITTPEPGELWERPQAGDSNSLSVQRESAMGPTQVVALALGLSVFVVIVGAALIAKCHKGQRSQPTDRASDVLEPIGQAAERIRAGEDARTVVLLCYQEMMHILSTAGKINAIYLTPREFEIRLRALGLSGDAIHELTAIFEIVRYAERANDGFAARALACLEAIQEAHTIDRT
ncbi:DUF4129 domain-containing protein [Candidatus Bipolaricaulota bacterium]|nr:DUF4129 domain-containing protein [Candidatus Bipolaricaulota bacterium]